MHRRWRGRKTLSLRALPVAVGALAASVLPIVSVGAIPRPAGVPPFYSVPAQSTWPSTAPGTYLKSQPVTGTGIAGQVWRVMYVSQGNLGKPVAATGYVAVPAGRVPSAGWPVVAWSHGTNGMADVCAPSIAIAHTDLPALAINAFLDQKWAFVAPDYQGEGTPGLLPYLVGASAAKDTINLVRAARSIPGAHTSTSWVDWGHSEGGQAAMFVDRLGPTYGTGLHLLGVVAGAPPSQFQSFDAYLKASPYAFYLVMLLFGYNAYYGNAAAPLSAVLTPTGIALLPDVSAKVTTVSQCTGLIMSAVQPYVTSNTFSKLQKADPWTVPAWRFLFTANDPGKFTTKSSVPLLMIQGGADEVVPVASTALLYNHLCSLGQIAQRWVYPGQSHAGVVTPSFVDMLHWMADRFAGGKSPDPYRPVGSRGVVPTAQTCN